MNFVSPPEHQPTLQNASSAPRVRQVAARAVEIPLADPVKTSAGVVATAPLVLIDVTIDQGLIGRAYLFTYTSAALGATRHLVEAFGAALVGAPLAPWDLDRKMSGQYRLLGRTGLAAMACAGLDMAFWDAQAKLHGQPLVRHLGASPQPIPAYASHAMDGLEHGCRRAEAALRDGFRAIKTKIGYADLREERDILRALRRTVGDDVALMVDYNQALDIQEARRRWPMLAEFRPAWIEEPLGWDDPEGHALAKQGAPAPIQIGENWFGWRDMRRALQLGACDLAMPDVMKIGGVSGWLRAANLAEQAGMPISSHLFPEISAHLLAASPTAHWLEHLDLAGPILQNPARPVGGHLSASDAPGTGVEWDEAAVRRFLV